MALKIPISSPLTETQAELTSKIGSMKSLLSLSVDKYLNIPKNKQLSTFDYLLKVMKSMGIEPELIFNLFLDKVFDEAGTFLEENVLNAVADSIGERGIQISPFINKHKASVSNSQITDPTPGLSSGATDPTDSEIKSYKENNRVYLSSAIPATFLQAVKQQMAKNLAMMIFGPKDGLIAQYLNPDSSERKRLFDDSICGESLFSLSSDPIVNQEDVEYNKIKLRKQLEIGAIIFEISCQEVKIKLPDNIVPIFEGGGMFTSSTSVPNPSQSLKLLIQHVKNQGQNINNEQNSNSIGKSFFEIMLAKLLNYISSLVTPFLGPIFSFINNIPSPLDLSTPPPSSANLSASNVAYSNCELSNSANEAGSGAKQKQEFFKSLANALLKELLKMLLAFVIKEFKKLVSNYFAKTEIEKTKIRAEKVKQKFSIFDKLGNAAKTASKARKYAAAASSLASIIGEVGLPPE